MKCELAEMQTEHFEELFKIGRIAEPWAADLSYEQFVCLMEKREGYVIKHEGLIIGSISFSDLLLGLNVTIHCTVRDDYHNRWCTKVILKEIGRFIFVELDLPRMTAVSIDKITDKAGEFLIRLGFSVEGRMRKAVKLKNKFYDLMFYGILKEECKWI